MNLEYGTQLILMLIVRFDKKLISTLNINVRKI